ncbi:MAG: efflux RND transporter periplasmic adaptor subunit [Ruegeria sp.]
MKRSGFCSVISVSLWALLAGTAGAETLIVSKQTVTEWKPVYGQVEPRDRVPARARIGGTIRVLDVTEGDRVDEGARLAVVEDDKLAFRIDALDARLQSVTAQLATARSDLERGEKLQERGVISAQRLDQLRTAVDVLAGQISNLEAERLIVQQQIAEGEVLAPDTGVVLSVPVAQGSVVTPGEAIAEIAGGGVFLRLSVPERFASDLAEGDQIELAGSGPSGTGELVKLYPLIEGGRVQADVEIDGLDGRFVGRRVPVRLPVAKREAILVPDRAITTHNGLDFVLVQTDAGTIERTIVQGDAIDRDGETWRVILGGLDAGETVVIDDE